MVAAVVYQPIQQRRTLINSATLLTADRAEETPVMNFGPNCSCNSKGQCISLNSLEAHARKGNIRTGKYFDKEEQAIVHEPGPAHMRESGHKSH